MGTYPFGVNWKEGVKTGAAGFGTEDGRLNWPGTNSTALAFKAFDGVGVV